VTPYLLVPVFWTKESIGYLCRLAVVILTTGLVMTHLPT